MTFNVFFTLEIFTTFTATKLFEICVNQLMRLQFNCTTETPCWFWRDYSVWLAEPLCAIFNCSIRHGIVPSIWKQANVAPVKSISNKN